MNEVVKDPVTEFGALYFGCGEMLYRACVLYARTVAEDPGSRRRFAGRYPTIPSQAWLRFERVGLGKWHPYLLLGGGVAQAHVRRLPPSLQTQVVEQGVELLSSDGSALRVKLESLSLRQCAQVFGPDHVRDLGEQRAWTERQKRDPAKAEAAAEPYRITSQGLTVFRGSLPPLVFSWAQLARIARMKGA